MEFQVNRRMEATKTHTQTHIPFETDVSIVLVQFKNF